MPTSFLRYVFPEFFFLGHSRVLPSILGVGVTKIDFRNVPKHQFANLSVQAMAIVTKALNYSSTYLPTVWSNYQFTVSLDQVQILAIQDEAQWLINSILTKTTAVP